MANSLDNPQINKAIATSLYRFTGMREKPRRLGRFGPRGRQRRPLVLIGCLLLFDVLPNNVNRSSPTTPGKIAR